MNSVRELIIEKGPGEQYKQFPLGTGDANYDDNSCPKDGSWSATVSGTWTNGELQKLLAAFLFLRRRFLVAQARGVHCN